MRLVKWFSFPAAILAFCCTGASGADGLYQPSAFAAPEPDVAACSYLLSDCEPGGCGAACEAACDSGCGGCNSSSCGVCMPLFPCGCLGDAWTLQGVLNGGCQKCSAISYGGWVSVGAYGNEHNWADNGPVGMRNVGDGFTVNQVWGFFEKAVNTGGYGWDWGFRSDFVFGADGPDTQAFGSTDPAAWDNSWDSSRDYGSALPQFYAEVGINDLTIKLGHFYTILGYEVVQAPDNFFTSHAYTMYYGEPFTHTGVLAEYSLGQYTLLGGWVQGWDTAFDNPLGSNDFLGGIRAPLTDSIDLTWIVDFGHDDVTDDDVFLQSVVAEVCLTERLDYVFQTDYGTSSGATNGQWYGLNNYLFYTINDCWKLGGRAEWFRDDDGLRGLEVGDYYGVTAGLNWQATANLRIRPELRYDWYEGAGTQPFAGGAADDQFSGGFDIIYTF